MYENDIYSGAGAGSNTSGAQSGNQTNTGGYGGSYSGGSYSANTDNNLYGNAEYRTYTGQNSGGAFGGPDGVGREKPKKAEKGGFLRKAMLAVSLGLFFGLFAGLGFYAVQQTAGALEQGGTQPAVSQIPQTDLAAEESQSGIKLTDTGSIRVVSSDVSDVVDEVMPAMVSIVNNYTQKGITIFGQEYSQDGAASGSGIIVAESDTELLIATNYHVIAEATGLDVTFIDGSTAQAKIKGTDADMDLAVIAIPLESLSEDTKSAISIAALGDSDELKLGEPVIAIGNSLGYGQSVTNGIVSALDREIPVDGGAVGTFIQTNAAINPGNSGGALLNVNGEVVGINSNKIGNELVEGMGYAIPISAAKPIIAEMMLKETRDNKVADSEAGYLGITLQTVTNEFAMMYNLPQGIFVLDVAEGSPAQQAGILKGDIITSFDGERITSWEDMESTLQYYAAGSSAKVKIKRAENGEYKDVELTITLGTKPAGVQ